MAISYSENYVTKKATTNVAGTGANFRLAYVVRNPSGKPVDNVTATISQVTTEGEGDATVENLTRIGYATVDVANNRNYFSFEKHAEVTLPNQKTIADQYYTDLVTILA